MHSVRVAQKGAISHQKNSHFQYRQHVLAFGVGLLPPAIAGWLVIQYIK